MIFLDIETLPTSDPVIIESIKGNLKAPSNYKDPEKIKAYIDNSVDGAIHKTGLSGLFGKVLCVDVVEDDSADHQMFYLDDYDSERNMLSELRTMLCSTNVASQHYCADTLVGHNILNFDVPFLSQRMMINGLKPLFRHGVKPWDLPVDDTMLMFAAGTKSMYSLANLCLAFGVQSPKSNLSGDMVHQAYLDGRHDEIKQYCADDVNATRQIYNAMVK